MLSSERRLCRAVSAFLRVAVREAPHDLAQIEMAARDRAARAIGRCWLHRLHRRHVRTASQRLPALLMALSATFQHGHCSTHHVPLLLCTQQLLRAARSYECEPRGGGGDDDGAVSVESSREAPSLLQHYFEAAYAKKRPDLYRLFMQLLFAGKLVLLVDYDARLPAFADAATLRAHALLKRYLFERLPLEVSRIVLAGTLATSDCKQLQQHFVTLNVHREPPERERQSVRNKRTHTEKRAHERGLLTWFLAQQGRFAHDATHPLSENDELSAGK